MPRLRAANPGALAQRPAEGPERAAAGNDVWGEVQPRGVAAVQGGTGGGAMKPYYEHAGVTIYHGDAREVAAWRVADVMLTDPPYGICWKQGALKRSRSDAHDGIVGDLDTSARDEILATFGMERCAAVFGSLAIAPPNGTKQVLIFQKPPNAGTRGAFGGFRRDVEAIYLLGRWSAGLGGRSSVLRTGKRTQGNPSSDQGRYHHPHAKPVDVLAALLEAMPLGVVADPFMGSGSTLVAAKENGRRAIGIEIEERYCEIAARRLGQEVLFGQPEATP